MVYLFVLIHIMFINWNLPKLKLQLFQHSTRQKTSERKSELSPHLLFSWTELFTNQRTEFWKSELNWTLFTKKSERPIHCHWHISYFWVTLDSLIWKKTKAQTSQTTQKRLNLERGSFQVYSKHSGWPEF